MGVGWSGVTGGLVNECVFRATIDEFPFSGRGGLVFERSIVVATANTAASSVHTLALYQHSTNATFVFSHKTCVIYCQFSLAPLLLCYAVCSPGLGTDEDCASFAGSALCVHPHHHNTCNSAV